MVANKLETRQFTGGLNSDDSEEIIRSEDYRNAINIQALPQADGKLGSILNVRGNKLIGNEIGALGKGGKFQTIGTCEDEKERCIYDFLRNSDGHHLIMRRDKSGSTLLLDGDRFTQEGTFKGLNFSEENLITGVATVGDTLFWTDPIPRRINIKRLLDGQYNSFDDDLISLIRRPPNLPPTWAKIRTGDAGKVSMIKDNAFQFTWRFVYYDGENSVFSPYSTMANYGAGKDNNDTINVILPADNPIKQDVRFIELAVRFGNTGDLFIIKRWDRDNADDAVEIEAHNEGNSLSYNFLNDRIGEAVAEADGIKPFENVPLESKALEAADNRIFLGNNKSGYDTPSKTDITLSAETIDVDVDGEKVTAEWWWGAENYKSGFPLHVKSHTSWFLYLSGVEGKEDGYYGIADVDYSKRGSNLTTGDNTKAPDSSFSFPDPVNYSDLQHIGKTDTSIMNFYGFSNVGTRHFNKGRTGHTDTTLLGAPTQNNFKPVKVFKTGTSYQVGVVFYDRYLRACSVVTNENAKIRLTETSYSNKKYTNKINWQLSNDYSNIEIPEWAEYFSILMTNNLRTRFFMQTFPYEVSYVNKNDDGQYETKKEVYDPAFAGIQIDITSLSKDNLGYVFNKGDIVNLYIKDKDSLALSVIDQYGKYIVCNLVDIGDLTNTPEALIELYTPYKASTIEPFWEIGQMFPVDNPGTDNRQYSTTTGSIQGDTWIIARKFSSITTNGVEAMSPNDKYYQNWWTDGGRPNTTPRPGIGQATKETGIVFSNQYIPQTLINGLSSFDVLNSKDLPDSCGPIRNLVFTSKVQGSLGGVLLAICENETVSIYIGETELQSPDNQTTLAKSNGVIGTVNILRGSYGTINPESVVEWNGNVYWLCLKRNSIIRYATNGLYPISAYKMQSFFEARCNDLKTLTAEQIASFGYSGIFCPGGFNAKSNEYLISLPRSKKFPEFLDDIIRQTYKYDLAVVTGTPKHTEATEMNKLLFYGGTLAIDTMPATITLSYNDEILIDNVVLSSGMLEIPIFKAGRSNGKFKLTSTTGKATITINQLQPNYHLPDDGQEVVIAFKERADRWTSKYLYRPDWFCNIGNKLYSLSGGDFYEHETGNHNTFYSERFPSLIAFESNENPVTPKIFLSTQINANKPPDYLHIRTKRPYLTGEVVQSSHLKKESFDAEEGLFYSQFLFDRLSPNAPGETYDAKMFNGDEMRGKTGKIFMEFDQYEDEIELKTIGTYYDLSEGHLM